MWSVSLKAKEYDRKEEGNNFFLLWMSWRNSRNDILQVATTSSGIGYSGVVVYLTCVYNISVSVPTLNLYGLDEEYLLI